MPRRLLIILGAVTGCLAACSDPSHVRQTVGGEARGWVLRPIAPATMKRMLDPGPRLPPDYVFAGASVERVVLHARYLRRSDGVLLRLELTHPSSLYPRAWYSARFSLRLQVGAPPEASAVADAVLLTLKKHEGPVRWVRPTRLRGTDSVLEHVSPERLTLLAELLLLLLLIAAFAALVHRHLQESGPAPSLRAWRLDHADWAAAGLLLLLGLWRCWDLASPPINGDEASNLEPDFWLSWIVGYETAAHPPLHRFIIHATAGVPERLWLMRLPAVGLGIGSLGLIFRLARRHTAPGPALAILALAGTQALHFELSQQQRDYTLWLCLLLGAQLAFERATLGERRQWGWYGLWTLLALMTHYLQVFILLAQLLYTLSRHRALLRTQLLALAPALLGLAMLAIPVLLGLSVVERGAQPDQAWVDRVALSPLLITSGLAGLLPIALACLGGGRRAGGRSLGLVTLAALLGGLCLVATGPVWPRYLLPVLPLGLIWLASMLPTDWGRWGYLRRVAVVFGACLVLLLSRPRFDEWYAQRRQPALKTLVARSAPPTAGPRHLMIFPTWMFEVTHLELAGRRDYWNTGCISPRVGRRGDDLIIGFEDWLLENKQLDSALRTLGGLEVLVFSAPKKLPKALRRWLASRCSADEPVRASQYGPLQRYRCGGRPTVSKSPCRAFDPNLDNPKPANKR